MVFFAEKDKHTEPIVSVTTLRYEPITSNLLGSDDESILEALCYDATPQYHSFEGWPNEDILK